MKNPACRGVFTKKAIKRRRLPKKGGLDSWTVSQFKGRMLGKEEGVVFEGGF